MKIIDRAIQVHGGGGVSPDFPLAGFWVYARTLRLADGPDEVHLESIAKMEIKMNVRPAVSDDAVLAAYAYNHYIATSHATFKLDPIEGREMLRRMESGWEGRSSFPCLRRGKRCVRICVCFVTSRTSGVCSHR